MDRKEFVLVKRKVIPQFRKREKEKLEIERKNNCFWQAGEQCALEKKNILNCPRGGTFSAILNRGRMTKEEKKYGEFGQGKNQKKKYQRKVGVRKGEKRERNGEKE